MNHRAVTGMMVVGRLEMSRGGGLERDRVSRQVEVEEKYSSASSGLLPCQRRHRTNGIRIDRSCPIRLVQEETSTNCCNSHGN